MTRKQRRLVLIGSALGVLALAVALVLIALKDSIVFFNSPTDVVEKQHQARDPHSARRAGEGRQRRARRNLARPLRRHRRQEHGPGRLIRACCPICSAKGRAWWPKARSTARGTFKADSVLAKHDETYMPKEVADALKKQGHWKDEHGKSRLRCRRGRASDRRASDDRRARPLRAGARARLWRSCRPACRSSARAANDPVLMAVAGPTAVGAILSSWRSSFGALDRSATCGRTSPSSTCSRIRIRRSR